MSNRSSAHRADDAQLQAVDPHDRPCQRCRGPSFGRVRRLKRRGSDHSQLIELVPMCDPCARLPLESVRSEALATVLMAFGTLMVVAGLSSWPAWSAVMLGVVSLGLGYAWLRISVGVQRRAVLLNPARPRGRQQRPAPM